MHATAAAEEAVLSSRETPEQLYLDHHRDVLRFAFLLTGDVDLASDLMQEAFVRTYGRIRVPETAAAYLKKTVVNVLRTNLRRRWTEARLRGRPDTRAGPDPSERIDLDRALARLPVRQRACLVLRFYEDLSEPQAAEILGVSVGTVKSQTHKALRKLRAQLGGESDAG